MKRKQLDAGAVITDAALTLNRLVTVVSPKSALGGFEIVATAFAVLLDTYAAPNANNPDGMCDDPMAFRRHFCDTIMKAATTAPFKRVR